MKIPNYPTERCPLMWPFTGPTERCATVGSSTCIIYRPCVSFRDSGFCIYDLSLVCFALLCSNWQRVEEDCRRAIQLDGSSRKGHYMLGLALLKKEEYSEGVKELEKALDIAMGANPTNYMVEEIWQALGNAKYLLWEKESLKRSSELQTLKETCEESLRQTHLLNTCQMEALKKLFDKAVVDDNPTEVPDHLCCKISLEIFSDPIITPSGNTYERAVLLDHLKKVVGFDPFTREPLDPSQLVPNLAIKEAVEVFLSKHGWAYKSG